MTLSVMYNISIEGKIMNNKLLKDKRLSKNLTQKELAKQVNISERHYQGIELGKRSPSIKLALRLCEILEIDLADLFPRQP